MRLDTEATIQAAAVLLSNTPNSRMSYLRLLKLLYLADREMLKQTGLPITFDRAVAMKHGPVLSDTYNLIKGEHYLADSWESHIKTDGYHAVLIERPGRGKLSKRAVSILHSVQKSVNHLNDWDLVDHMHEVIGEWAKHAPDENSSRPIPLQDILHEVGYGDDETSEIIDIIESDSEYRTPA